MPNSSTHPNDLAVGVLPLTGARADYDPLLEEEAVQQLVEVQRRAGELARRDGRIPEDEFFYAEQNARLVRDTEAYYRAMFGGRVASWNLRDRHMAESLDALLSHLDRTRAVEPLEETPAWTSGEAEETYPFGI